MTAKPHPDHINEPEVRALRDRLVEYVFSLDETELLRLLSDLLPPEATDPELVQAVAALPVEEALTDEAYYDEVRAGLAQASQGGYVTLEGWRAKVADRHR